MRTGPSPERETRHEAELARQPAGRASDDSEKHIGSLGFHNGHALPWGRHQKKFNGARGVCFCVSPISGEMTGTTISDVSSADVWQMWHCPSYQSASYEQPCVGVGAGTVDRCGCAHVAFLKSTAHRAGAAFKR